MSWDVDGLMARAVPEPNTGCWLWMLSVDGWGYARSQVPMPNGSLEGLVHRAVFRLSNPSMEVDGLHIHHTCRQPSCINPDHLKAVTPAEHLALDDPGYIRRRRRPKEFCPAGHKLEGDNLVVITLRKTGRISRQCRECRKVAAHKYYEKRKEATNGQD